jgi:hypothetical protein
MILKNAKIVSEHYKQVQIQLSDEERRRSWNPAIATGTDLEATGELCFSKSRPIFPNLSGNAGATASGGSWKSSGDLIAGLIKAARNPEGVGTHPG